MSAIHRARRQRGAGAGCALALLLGAAPARLRAEPARLGAEPAPLGAEPDPEPSRIEAPAAEEPNPEKARQTLRRLTEPGGYLQVFSTLMFGEGVRFNNPYRLSHELGQGGESLSLTAPYVDLALVVATGAPTRLVHGGRLSWSIAMSGVPQGVVTPAYLAALRPSGHWLVYAWLGVPFLTAPDLNVGGELALGGTYFVRAGVGVCAALVADAFYGAGTRETRSAFYPVLSAQLGVSLNYEVLP